MPRNTNARCWSLAEGLSRLAKSNRKIMTASPFERAWQETFQNVLKIWPRLELPLHLQPEHDHLAGHGATVLIADLVVDETPVNGM
jgi:hypothetical protein